MYSNLVYTSFLVQHIRWLQQAITVIDTIWEGQWIENYLCTSAFAGNQMQDCSSKWGLLLTPPWPTSLTYTLVNLKTQKNTTFLLENRIFVYFEQYGSNSVACVLIILYLSQKKKKMWFIQCCIISPYCMMVYPNWLIILHMSACPIVTSAASLRYLTLGVTNSLFLQSLFTANYKFIITNCELQRCSLIQHDKGKI